MLYICTSLFLWLICFFVHVHLFGLWVLEIYIVEKMYIFTFCFSIFFLLLFSFLGLLCIFLSVRYSFVGLFRSNVLSLHKGQRILKLFFGFFSLFRCFWVFFLVLLLFLYVFVLTLLVDVFSFLLFLFVCGLCFVGPSTSV